MHLYLVFIISNNSFIFYCLFKLLFYREVYSSILTSLAWMQYSATQWSWTHSIITPRRSASLHHVGVRSATSRRPLQEAGSHWPSSYHTGHHGRLQDADWTLLPRVPLSNAYSGWKRETQLSNLYSDLTWDETVTAWTHAPHLQKCSRWGLFPIPYGMKREHLR
jgi:hypothetical protein